MAGRLNLLDYYKIIGLKAKYREWDFSDLKMLYQAEKIWPHCLEVIIEKKAVEGRNAEIAMGVSLAADENFFEHTFRTLSDILLKSFTD